MDGAKKLIHAGNPAHSTLGQVVCCVLFFIMFTGLGSCNQKNISTHLQPSEQTVVLNGARIYLFNNPHFITTVPSLEVQSYEVTNASFNQFVQSTGYITRAEKSGEGMVFNRKKKKWELTRGANWKHPQGPGSDIKNKTNYPVVQVAYEDACAYCAWLDMRLPYESEWEYMFQLDAKKPATQSNHWDGIFPVEDKGTDGFMGSSPVGYFGKGGGDCYDLQGNVWEWCLDYYHEQWPALGLELNDSNRYTGPPKSFSENAIYDTLRVIKGGSFLCADNYCKGYTNTVRMYADPNLGYEHTGFRCVKNK